MEVMISAAGVPPEELQEALQNYYLDQFDLPKFEVKLPEAGYRDLTGMDSSVLVALVSVGGTALGALLTGLLKIAQGRNAAKIVIQGKSGRRLEIPADTPVQTMDELLSKVKLIDSPDNGQEDRSV